MSRSKGRLYALAIALGAPTLALVVFASSADAEEKKKPAKPAAAERSDRYDPDNISAISQYMEAIVKGNDAIQAKNVTGAVDHYKKAVQLNPKHPLGLYLLGEAYLLNNNVAEAEAAFLQAQETADSKNPMLRGHVLFAVADVYERQKKWPEAKAAWQAYLEHASRLSADSGAHAASGVARKDMVDKAIEREKAYAAVRERIAAEKAASKDAGPAKK